jgi:hypothetical protein
MVITAGLAPTDFNDGQNAIDDRVFLQDMFSNDVEEISDAIGAHPLGWANPPDATCCDQPEGVESHYEDSHFYFLETLAAYRAIMNRNGANDVPIWVTKFGWGSSEGDVLPFPDSIANNEDRLANFAYLDYTTEAEQALYIVGGFEQAGELGYIGPMILSNLNACQYNDWEACFLSLIDASGAARPAFGAVQNIDKSDE